MTTEERELRNQLRAHGRQLGDRRDDRRDTQEIEHLVQACAYEHWHRMLFARFLAENDLLLDPDHGVAMTLEEVRELSREQNREWIEIAAELAQKMLLAVFRPDDPVLRVSLPLETRQHLEEKLGALPTAVFQADDSLGWVYQFWQRDEKDRVNKSEVKIGADELPAVTQLFTEDYMVLFLLENTLGAWWTAKRLAEGKNPALPGYGWTYLRLNEDGSPAVGLFDGWPRAVRELRMLDPSMGSGHFLTFALPILVRMRVEEEGLALQEAVAAVLRENLYGLELDARCSQIAAFNLALAAWRLAGEHLPLPELNLACSGLGIHAAESDWVKLAGEDGLAREEMRRLYSLFKDAPTLGSLIDPLRLRATVFSAGADRVLSLIEEALEREQSEDVRELAIAAQGVLAAFRILASRFTLVATNVPYLGRGKQDPALAQYCAEFHVDAKADLATCFVERCMRFCGSGGSVALVTPQNWLFLTSYRQLRERLLKSEQLDFVARLGPRAFETISGEVVNVALLGLTHRVPSPHHSFAGWDVAEARSPEDKAKGLNSTGTPNHQARQLKNPSMVITTTELLHGTTLADYAGSVEGLSTGDSDRFVFRFWELPRITGDWTAFQRSPQDSEGDLGSDSVLRWQNGKGELVKSEAARVQGFQAWGVLGVVVGQMRTLLCGLSLGQPHDKITAVLVPRDSSFLPAILAYCESEQYNDDVRKINSKLNAATAALVQVPFDLSSWQEVAARKYPNGIPAPRSDNPTQWLFNGNVRLSGQPLQVAVARLVGYAWPRQTGSAFAKCPELNIDGLQLHADADGIACMNAIAGEASAADRLRALLAHAYGNEWSAAKLQSLLDDKSSLEEWLRDEFFEEHCRVFQHRPFVWHVWDGRKDGFHSFVNYHKLAGPNGEGRKTLEKLIYTYLGRWIDRQSEEVRTGKEGADARLAAALHLKAELEKILAGEKPYDLFNRWKPLNEQPIGWAPDLNDGVRINIRPWLTAKPYQSGRRDGCILRVTPRVNYGKDRGKEPHKPKDDFPWFWSWDGQSDDFLGGKDFDGARWNDLHYSLEAKRDARLRVQSQGSSK
ncbi:Eco57I restriction-modification methylase domain-containing protein [Bryobacter aggregatus]|uniref:Eco57I restriction-modification methylase domain-containing protein n=1 Tax=Bryobacter aggregatus TaxID=360054 RepID=UPI000AE96C7A|nr:hypothetical protein [Bryobacter aggregatus]